jgi:hypothetical protein
MKTTLLTIFFLCITFSLYAQGIDPTVAAIIDNVNADSLTYFVSELSGEIPVTVNSTQYTIASRYDTASGNAIAALYINQKLQSYGLIPQFQDFSPSGRNVFAVQTGVDHPGQMYIICAHYDDQPKGSIAPGADDNASGTAAVIEAARIFSKYQTSYTILYALWDREEQGLYGSAYYSNLASALGDSILGVINLDMIAWDGNDDMVMDIHTSSTGNSLELSDTVSFVNTTYNIGLMPVVKNPGTSASDHASFWANNYGAILLIESFSDFNLYYHKTSDLLNVFNNTFFHKMSKLALGTIATLTGVHEATGVSITEGTVSNYVLSQNYPNPFNPVTTIDYQLSSLTPVTLEVFDMLGRRVAILVDDTKPAGKHTAMWNASDYSSGMYVYRLRAGDYSQMKIMALIK